MDTKKVMGMSVNSVDSDSANPPPYSQRENEIDALNSIMGKNPEKLPYECITNIPNDAKLLRYYFEIIDNKHLKFTFKQDAPGKEWESFIKELVSTKIVDGNLCYQKKSPDAAGLNGTGIYEMSKYVDKSHGLYIYCKPSNGESWHFNYMSENPRVEYVDSTDWDYGWRMDMTIEKQPQIKTWKDYIKLFMEKISWIDGANIKNGRVHQFHVGDKSGELSKTELKSLNKRLKADVVTYEAGSERTGFPGEDEKNRVTELIVSAMNNAKTDKDITLNVNVIGIRRNAPAGAGEWEDRPECIIRYAETDQIVHTIHLRDKGGDAQLNNIVVDVSISKDELSGFFNSTDKSTGLMSTLEKVIYDRLRTELKRMYPDNKTLEGQIRDLLKQKLTGDGEDNDRLRDRLGLEEMNGMTCNQREVCVDTEYSHRHSRFDVRVNTPSGGVLIIEIKKSKWSKANSDRLYRYIGVETVTLQPGQRLSAVAVTGDIDDKSKHHYDNLITDVDLAGSTAKVLPMIDIGEWGIPNVF